MTERAASRDESLSLQRCTRRVRDRRAVAWAQALALAFAMSLAASPAFAGSACPPRYEVTATIAPPDCAIFGGGSAARDMNNAAEIVGWLGCDIDEDAFIWQGEGQPTLIPMPPGTQGSDARAINDEGVVVGFMTPASGGRHAFVYDGTVASLLGTPPGTERSEAFGVNSAGTIAGYYRLEGVLDALPAIWQDGKRIDLPIEDAWAVDVNDLGQVVGWRWVSARLAFLWDAGKVINIDPIPGGVSTSPRAMNNLREVVGAMGLPTPDGGTDARAFLWRDGQTIDLGILPGYEDSSAQDINDSSQILGESWGGLPNDRACLWADGGLWALNDLVVPPFEHWFTAPVAINNQGQIVARGSVPGGLATFLLTPLAPMPADLDCDRAVGFADLLLLLGNWGPCLECDADIDGSGSVDVLDLQALLDSWG